MLQTLRNNIRGWIAYVILGLLVIPFAFFGVENYFSSQVATWVAKVGEQEIAQEEFRLRFEEYRQQMRRVLGENFDARQFEQPLVKRQFLDRLIEEKLLEQVAESEGLVVPPSVLQKQIMDVPAFQVDGRFDGERYRMMLAGQNMTPVGFEQRIRRDLLLQTLPAGISSSAFVTDAQLDDYLRLRDQTRGFRYLVLPAPEASAIDEPEADAVETYYREHPELFTREETVEIEFVQVSPQDVEVPVTASEDALRQRYEEQRLRFVQPGARLASHILIEVDANADADAVDAARERAAALAEQARAEGADFAALARENSEDIGSKSSGGDLGWIEPGITDPAFEDALFALAEGEVSDPVKGDAGWHVIQVREVREEQGKSFEEVRAELEREYLQGERERAFSEVSGRLVDLVYRDPTSLVSASDELGLEVQRAGPFGRGGGEGLAGNRAVVDAAFSESVLQDGNVSDPIELDDGSVVVVRVARHQPATPMPFEDVEPAAREGLRAERLAALASEQAGAALAELQAGTALETLAADRGLEVAEAPEVGRTSALVERPIVTRAFELPRPEGEQRPTGMAEIGGNRHALIVLESVKDGDPSSLDASARTALREQLARGLASAEARAFLDALRASAEISVAEERL